MVPARDPLTFGRERRVRKRSDFNRMQRESRRVTTRHYVLLVAARAARAFDTGVVGKDGAAGPSRLGLIVTRKIGNAVARNRVKRVCRACFRQWPSLLPDGVDLVVVAKTGADELCLADVRAEWEGVAELVRKRASEALARARSMPHVSGGRRPR
jgi:ribonuclease P protein component